MRHSVIVKQENTCKVMIFCTIFMILFSSASLAIFLTTPVKILSGEKGMRGRLDFFDMENPANQTLSVILTDTLNQPIENATINLSIINTTGKAAFFVLSQTGTGNYSLNYSFESIGYYNISVNITRGGFPGISGMKRIYVGYVEFSEFSNEEGAFQNTVAYFRLAARNLGNASSQVVPVINIFDSGGTLIFSRTGVSTTIQGNKTVSLLQYNILTFNVGSTSTGNYRITAYLIFTDKNNQTSFTPNRTSALRILAQPTAGGAEAVISTPGGIATEPVISRTTSYESFSPDKTNVVEIDNEKIGFKEISIDVNNAVKNVEVKVSSLARLPFSVTKSPEGKVYQYIEVKHTLKDEDIRGAKVRFTVTKKWLSDNSLTKHRIALKRYSGNEWGSLKTKVAGESPSEITYESELPGLSIFAIGEDTERPETDLQFISVPKLIEIFPGGQRLEAISVLNPQDKPIDNIIASIEGIPQEWFSIIDDSFSLEAGEDKTIPILFSIPPNAIPGNYQAKINLFNNNISRSFPFFLRINTLGQISQTNAEITKSIEIKESEKETYFTIKVKNSDKPFNSMKIIERIDKSVASNINEIVFSKPPSRIIQADPVVEFEFTDLNPFEQRNVTYYVKKIVNTTAPFIYSTIEQITTIEKIAEIGKVVQEISAPLIILLLILIAVIAAIIIILYIRSRRKSRKEVKEIEKIIVRVES